ncbi:uncharacterized protein IWZ02DRAFT_106290 [Phyllosticta citriasiana]|uniref:uncharacterized protein n=1 Tax=Phyllosticta citriasiana TaxID=595635 RepID=UPI0030FDDC4E
MATHEAQPKTDQADQSDPSDDTPQAADQFDQSDDDAMKGSSRHRSSRIDQQPSPKQKAHEKQQQPSEAQAKPLNHNDLVKWIVVSDAPDYASVVAEFSNAKGYPVLPRSPKHLEKFGARELRIGLKCLRKMNDAAREENGKLEAEAQALGCADGEASSAMELEQQHVEEGPNTPKAIEDADRSMQLDVESKNSLIAILHFNLSFYRSKVLPFIQACLIAEGRRKFPLLSQSLTSNKQAHSQGPSM